MMKFVAFLALIQTVPIGSALSDGMQLVYESGGVEQAPWVYDSVRVASRDGFDRCVTVARRAQDPRESCMRADTLFERNAADAHAAARPLAPNMTLAVHTASGNTLHYTTADVATRSIAGGGDVQVIRTTILIRDSTGAVLRRLREDYAPALLTAAWGVFEEPDGVGGWRIVREFSLAAVRSAVAPPHD